MSGGGRQPTQGAASCSRFLFLRRLFRVAPLPLRPARFDAVLDKGTADALDCGGDEGAARLLGEAARASRVGGAVVMISCRDAVRRTADFKAVPTLTLVSVADVGGEPGKPCPDAVVLVATVGPPAALSEGRE